MAFSDNVKRLRERKNYSQSELAELVGVSQQAIADYEKGKKIPNIVTGVDLARKLDATVEQLLDSNVSDKSEEENT